MRSTRFKRTAALIAACLLQGLLLGCLCGGSLPGIKVSTSGGTAAAAPTLPPAAQATATPATFPTRAGGAGAGPVFPRPYAYTEAEAAGLSEDQRGVLHDLGWPHAFSAIRLPDAEGVDHWVETWHYYDIGLVFVFRDRAFHHQEAERAVPAHQIAATSYRPNQFWSNELLPDLQWAEMEAFNELLPAETRFFIQEGVILGFLDEKLAFVEAIAMLPRGE